MSNVEVKELTHELIAGVSHLLVNYMYPTESWLTEHREICEQNLKRLLEFRLAELFVAANKETLLGFIALNWGFSTTKGQPILKIQDLYVIPEARKQGIAELLINKAKSLAKQHHCNRVQLDTNTNNVPARSLYEKLGFEWLPDKEIYMHFL